MDKITKEHQEEILKKVSGEKNLYPSQINTKTISCRISAIDYVQFLNDAISKGISLNDWLLTKIYSNSNNIGSLKNKSNNIQFEEYYPIFFDTSWGDLQFENELELVDFINDCHSKISELQSNILLSKDLVTLQVHTLFLELKSLISKEIEWDSKEDRLDFIEDIKNKFQTVFKDIDLDKKPEKSNGSKNILYKR